MREPIALDSLFKEKVFRIPDYQRGYAWGKDQLKDFWEDLINLSDDRSHYTGLLTMREMKENEIAEEDNEYWLIEDHSYKMYEVVDGQQRLTTVVIFLQAFINVVMKLNPEKDPKDIYITNSLSLAAIINRYLYKLKPTQTQYRTYKFGYAKDNPSDEFMRHRILNEPNGGTIKETFYTLNLKNAKSYFIQQLEELYEEEKMEGLKKIYRKLTKNFLFNEFIIKDEFDVFVAFETMNNRGKKLSDLELLKNRLIYLTTLYEIQDLDTADRINIRNDINDAWKETYHQLGRNDKHPLNDDDFLKAHWIMYFKYSRKQGNDYIKYLLDEQFSPQKIYKNIEKGVKLEAPEEHRTDFEIIENDDEASEIQQEPIIEQRAQLQPLEIKSYVHSLKESAVHWFNSHYPELATELTLEEKNSLDRLNRIGMGYFRPLIMAIMKKEPDVDERVKVFNSIERFIFLVFRLGQARRNYKDSEFYNAAREFDKGEIDLKSIEDKLVNASTYLFNESGKFNEKVFYEFIEKKFNKTDGRGYYGWHGLRYFLYEYELSLLAGSRQQKVQWDDLLKSPKDRISIEHIYPQTPKHDEWLENFKMIPIEDQVYYQGSLGNLLLLSTSINSSLQNDCFEQKKNPKLNINGEKIRNGYSDGSHSEIEVSTYREWTPISIKERGMKLLTFLEKRWNIEFENDMSKEKLLFIK
ncbi:DUF262 domain-containing protein [Sporosarcina sp. FSL K6-6792]|uniref:DUF262 domain-containing protein n=1 Tax=Sporosarcina sp. FSL K6-6792 TaxID=2921559 RepID=UPI0030FB29BE